MTKKDKLMLRRITTCLHSLGSNAQKGFGNIEKLKQPEHLDTYQLAILDCIAIVEHCFGPDTDNKGNKL